jgi:hypothetical protein
VKKTFRILPLFTLFACTLILSSCKKMQDAKLTFFVSNAGDAHKWAHIRVDINGQSQSFFTPENSNMVLGGCQEDDNATTFYLPAGTYNYTADFGTWSGSVTVDGGDCRLIELRY